MDWKKIVHPTAGKIDLSAPVRKNKFGGGKKGVVLKREWGDMKKNSAPPPPRDKSWIRPWCPEWYDRIRIRKAGIDTL